MAKKKQPEAAPGVECLPDLALKAVQRIAGLEAELAALRKRLGEVAPGDPLAPPRERGLFDGPLPAPSDAVAPEDPS